MAERFDIGYEWLLAQGCRLERKARQELEKQLKDFCVNGKYGENLKEIYNCKKMSVSNIYWFAMSKYEQKREKEETEKEEAEGTECKTKESCLADCKNAVEKVLEVRLKKDFKEDYYYAIGQAFDELEQIRGRVLDKQRFLFYKFVMAGAGLEPKEQDLADLREARSY